MWKDPIVEETRTAARELDERAGGDVHRFFENLRVAQSRYRERVVAKLCSDSSTDSEVVET